jgi:hypothetical protein
MKRLHVHVSVEDIAQSVRFYSTPFAAEPAVTKPENAKWMLDGTARSEKKPPDMPDRRGLVCSSYMECGLPIQPRTRPTVRSRSRGVKHAAQEKPPAVAQQGARNS